MSYEKLKTLKDLAARFNGREVESCYQITSVEEEAMLEKAGIVMVVNDNDAHLVRLRGAIDNTEHPIHGAQPIYFKNGDLFTFNPRCDVFYCPFSASYFKDAKYIKEIIDAQNGFTSRFETNIPHETFIFKKNGIQNCIGILFYLEDVQKPEDPAIPTKPAAEWVKTEDGYPDEPKTVLCILKNGAYAEKFKLLRYLGGKTFTQINGSNVHFMDVTHWLRIDLPDFPEL